LKTGSLGVVPVRYKVRPTKKNIDKLEG
jgi:hypothetical protein